MSRSGLGPSQHQPEEGRFPPGVHLVFLQQVEYHPGGRRQVYRNVLQEGTQGSCPDLKGHHEEPQDVRNNVRQSQQVCPGRGGDPRH
jgi:hypothetical protein